MVNQRHTEYANFAVKYIAMSKNTEHNKKTWKKPELKKLDGKNTESGFKANPTDEGLYYYKTTS